MGENRMQIITIAGSIIAVLLQLIFAPALAIGGIKPNFIIAFVIAFAITMSASNLPVVLAFVLGLIFNFLGTSPVGSLSLLLVIFVFAATKVFKSIDNDTIFVPLFVMGVTILLVNIFYSLFYLGNGVGFFEAVFLRGLPNALYDFAFSVLIYFLLKRLNPFYEQKEMPSIESQIII